MIELQRLSNSLFSIRFLLPLSEYVIIFSAVVNAVNVFWTWLNSSEDVILWFVFGICEAGAFRAFCWLTGVSRAVAIITALCGEKIRFLPICIDGYVEFTRGGILTSSLCESHNSAVSRRALCFCEIRPKPLCLLRVFTFYLFILAGFASNACRRCSTSVLRRLGV